MLLHGFGGSHRIWSEAAKAVEGEALTIAYDLPGHGGSLDRPGAGSAKAAADAVLADLARRGIERAHLAGHSMGGAVATLAAMAEPARVASLTLLAPGGFGPEINAPLLARFAEATDPDEIRACLAAMSAPDSAVADHAVEALAAERARLGQREKLVEIAALITRGGRQGVIPRDRIAALSIPVTVAWGTEDPVLPFSQSSDLPGNITLERVDGKGHMLVEEAPFLVESLLRQALKDA